MLATRDELAKQFPSQKVLAKICDVSSETQVNELVAFALRELGSLHALVLNAGIYGPMGATESVSLDEWRRALDINLYGVLLPCRAVIPHFKKAGRGKIVVLSAAAARPIHCRTSALTPRRRPPSSGSWKHWRRN